MLIYGSFDPAHHSFPQCPMRWLTGWLCPGCGSQRAIHQALHGHFMESFRLNTLFLPSILYGLIGLVISSLLPQKWPNVRKRFYGSDAAYIALATVLFFWVGRNIF